MADKSVQQVMLEQMGDGSVTMRTMTSRGSGRHSAWRRGDPGGTGLLSWLVEQATASEAPLGSAASGGGAAHARHGGGRRQLGKVLS
jgi:hypothetical protein